MLAVFAFFASLFAVKSLAADKKPQIVAGDVEYKSGEATMKGYVAYDDQSKGKLPVVLVVPEWWGNNEYAHMRARMLAELGYLAMAVDMYGDGKVAVTPGDAQALAGPFYKSPAMGVERIEAAMTYLAGHPRANMKLVAAVGYCFGGSMVLNAALSGSKLVAAVSFHGGLKTVAPKKGKVQARVLVCHGAADSFVPEAEVKAFKEQMAAAAVQYKFIAYDDATHAFTNPAATETGKKFDMPIRYNEAADKKSWDDMKGFLENAFVGR